MSSLEDFADEQAERCEHCEEPLPCSGDCKSRVDRPGIERSSDGLVVTTKVHPGDHLSALTQMVLDRNEDPSRWALTRWKANKWETARGTEDGWDVRELHQTTGWYEPVVPREEAEWGQFLDELRDIVTAPPPKTPNGGKRNRKKRDSELIVCIGDDQAPFINRPLHKATCKALADIRPSRIVYMGDGLDFPTVSKYPKSGTKFDADLNTCLRSLREALTERIDAAGLWGQKAGHWLDGNHDDRLRKWIASQAPALLGLRAHDGTEVLSVPYLLGLDSLGLEPAKGIYPNNTVKVARNLIARHGWVVRKGAGQSAHASMQHLSSGIVVGHTHRLGITHWTRWSADGRPNVFAAAETGTMAELSGLGYSTDPDWQAGWLTVDVHSDGTFALDLASWRNGTLRWRGEGWR